MATGLQAPIKALPALDPVPTLVQQCGRAIADSLCPESVCSCLMATSALAPALDHLQTQLLVHLASHLALVVLRDPSGFRGLSGSVIEQLLLCPALVSPCCRQQGAVQMRQCFAGNLTAHWALIWHRHASELLQ